MVFEIPFPQRDINLGSGWAGGFRQRNKHRMNTAKARPDPRYRLQISEPNGLKGREKGIEPGEAQYGRAKPNLFRSSGKGMNPPD